MVIVYNHLPLSERVPAIASSDGGVPPLLLYTALVVIILIFFYSLTTKVFKFGVQVWVSETRFTFLTAQPRLAKCAAV